MTSLSVVTNRALSDDLREEFLVSNIPTPVNSLVVEMLPESPDGFVIVNVKIKILSGTSIKLLFSINDVAVAFADDDVDNKILADAGGLDTFTPDGAAENYTIEAGDKFKFVCSDATGTPLSLVVQVTLRRTQV